MSRLKFFTGLFIFAFLWNNLLMAGPMQLTFTYQVTVTNETSAPESGVNIRLIGYYRVWEYQSDLGFYEWELRAATAEGSTNSSGYVSLIASADISRYYPDDYRVEFMMVEMVEPGYTVLSSQNTVSYFTNAAGSFVVIGDVDGNGVKDQWEMPLAQKFCPHLFLHSEDQGVRPVPVEIMDRNEDGHLGWEDVLVDVYTSAGDPIGSFSPSQIYVPNVIYKYLYPYYNPLEVADTWIDVNNDGCFSCPGDNIPPDHRILQPHFEWGSLASTTPSAWYGFWNTKLSQLSGNFKYTKGTTYAHLYKDGNYTVIQYWFFYPFNACSNRHEGDWEHINVILNSQNPTSAQILAVVYYYHEFRTTRTSSPLINSTHPIVYVGGWNSVSGLAGAGSHGSYPEPGTWELNLGFAVGIVEEDVDGLGLQINFNNYNNVVILPRYEHVKNNMPYIDPQGNNLDWMVYNSYWGYPISHPSAGEKDFEFFEALINTLTFGQGTKWFNLPSDVGNLAPAGPPQKVTWERTDYEQQYQTE